MRAHRGGADVSADAASPSLHRRGGGPCLSSARECRLRRAKGFDSTWNGGGRSRRPVAATARENHALKTRWVVKAVRRRRFKERNIESSPRTDARSAGLVRRAAHLRRPGPSRKTRSRQPCHAEVRRAGRRRSVRVVSQPGRMRNARAAACTAANSRCSASRAA